MLFDVYCVDNFSYDHFYHKQNLNLHFTKMTVSSHRKKLYFFNLLTTFFVFRCTQARNLINAKHVTWRFRTDLHWRGIRLCTKNMRELLLHLTSLPWWTRKVSIHIKWRVGYDSENCIYVLFQFGVIYVRSCTKLIWVTAHVIRGGNCDFSTSVFPNS